MRAEILPTAERIPPLSVKSNPSAQYVIARYLRISHEDDKKDESNSITYQRAMIQNFIDRQEDFSNAEVIDYVDDGKSGSHTDREAYQRLIYDVKRGTVQCIIVKDLSRIGRNLIEVDDLLMNYLVVYRTRFISINNGYDSFKHPLSNLELAVINLANQHYNQDLAQKSITSKHVKMKRGEYLSCFALFGYKKSGKEKNKIVIDGEAAGYVRLMFSLALDGHNLSDIARILNAQDIPTPSEYKKRHGITGGWKVVDSEYSFWCNALVSRILYDKRYTGKGITNMYKVKTPGKNTVSHRPREEWIIVPNAHEAIITEEDYQRALARLKKSKSDNVAVDHIFFGKVKCSKCHRTMKRSGKYNPHFSCGTKNYTDHYGCPSVSISQPSIETAVLSSIHVYAAALIEQEEITSALIRQNGSSKSELERLISAEEKNIRLLEESITKNFMAFVDKKVTQDVFLSKKELINSTIALKKTELEKLRQRLAAVTSGSGTSEQKLNMYRSWQRVEKLDREIVDLLVESVIVYGEQEIEIVWADMA